MEQSLRLEGIYDQRTLKQLKSLGISNFSFNFSPKSFNFIQEYVFLEQIINLTGYKERIFFHFQRSNDPMIFKLADDLKKIGHNLSNIYFEIDEWSSEMPAAFFPFKYMINFSLELELQKMIGSQFSGLVFEFKFFENLHRTQVLNNFINNFLTRYHPILNSSALMLLKVDWQDNLFMSLFDSFEFDIVSYPINSKIEVCYRNVDLKKLKSEMEIIFKK